MENTEFDFIIVGAGSAGCVLANRLSKDPSVQVCLIEAGKKDSHPLIHIPFGLAFLARLKSLNWNYQTEPQAELGGRQLYWPRGKVLGGSSSVNAMCYIRGVPEDYDHWQFLGAEGWDWDSVLPYFIKSEQHLNLTSPLHGQDGPLAVSHVRHVNPLSQAFVESASDVGLVQVNDFNSPERHGLGYYHVTQKNGQRCSAAKAYIAPVLTRKNLTILTRTQVNKILVKEGRAIGVQVKQDHRVVDYLAAKEVLLCAGAINSPQLLMLSGIGPKAELDKHNIPVVVASPGVGKNLQDHLDVMIQNQGKTRDSYSVMPALVPKYIKACFDYIVGRKGLMTSNIAESGGFDKTEATQTNPDIQYHFIPSILQDHGRVTVFNYGYGLHACGLYPKSRGEITLQSADPAAHPKINPNYLTDTADQTLMIAAFRKARNILASPRFKPYFTRELSPGKNVQTDEQILQFIRKNAESIYHPVGTCKMGHPSDKMAVVNSELKVNGIEALRVVDASVMPRIVGGNTNAPTIMIAEKCAHLISSAL